MILAIDIDLKHSFFYSMIVISSWLEMIDLIDCKGFYLIYCCFTTSLNVPLRTLLIGGIVRLYISLDQFFTA